MRKIVIMAAALALAGCGNSEDFAVDVAMSPGRAKAELATLDGGLGLRALSLPPVVVDAGTANELTFKIPGESEQGDLHLRFEEVGTNGTRIHVSLALPVKVASIQGKPMVLSEAKAEDLLEQRLRDWARQMQSGYASLDGLNEAMTGFSVAMKPEILSDVLDAADDPEKLAGLIDPAVMGELSGDTEGDTFAEVDMDTPMLDPTAGTDDASRPMDEALGDSEGDAGGGWGDGAS
jgi:hypothetical protein